MTDAYERYAVYWAPERGSALAAFGANWLGWDVETASDAPRMQVDGLPAPIVDLTVAPRRYGFHATLKPPFRLAEGCDRAGLEQAVEAQSHEITAFDAPPLALHAKYGFPALSPHAPCPELDALAAGCVTELDGFRAPPSDAELERRRAAGLSDRQEAHLIRWGYPYVLEEFRFHVTLAGKLPAKHWTSFAAALRPHISDVVGAPWRVREICLFGDPGAGLPFHLLKRFPLSG